MARRRRPPSGPKKKRKKKDDHTKTARRVTLQGGEMDGHQIWLGLPLPPNIKMNLGRDSYFKRDDNPGIYEYDPEREYVSQRSVQPPAG